MKQRFRIEYRTLWGESIIIKAVSNEQFLPTIKMTTQDGIFWEGDATFPDWTQYRYVVVKDGMITRTETACMPHIVFPSNLKSKEADVPKDAFEFGNSETDNGTFRIIEDKNGEKIQMFDDVWREPKRIAGVAVPIFSLRSKGSQGVGDFGDLKSLINWADSVHIKAIQILPINDTTTDGNWKDSYPYNSISTFALHPMYLDLRQTNKLESSIASNLKKEWTRLNTLPEVDYEKVNETKRKYISLLFEQDGNKVLRSKEYKSFFEDNSEWLIPYAMFRARHSITEEQPKGNNVRLYYFTQYLLHCQLLEVAQYAREKGIMLKGDIPIGINREGVDTATYPELFNMDGQTGAPPDYFSKDGQNWGFPTYNWEEMEKDGYRWWRRRMEHMGQYFSAYRIDHILGFFRIWEIPVPEKTGLKGHFSPALPLSIQEMWGHSESINENFLKLFLKDTRHPGKYFPKIGAKDEPEYKSLSPLERNTFDRLYEDFFYHRHNQFWYDEAMKKLPALTGSNLMVCCGEDLGMIPECVGWVMNRLDILSLEIQSMPKEMGVEFGDTSRYPLLSVCTISSHDTPTFRGWWEEEHQKAQRYFNDILKIKGTAPKKAPGWLCERVIRQHLASPSVLCILTIQDWLGIDEQLRNPVASSERINIPANPRHYWKWRMHLTLEELKSANSFNEHVRCLIDESR